jgi:histidine triad (HIT) family protein
VIRTLDDATAEDLAILGHLQFVAVKLAKQLGLTGGYRLVINCKEDGGQTVPHLHVHLLGGRNMKWPPG